MRRRLPPLPPEHPGGGEPPGPPVVGRGHGFTGGVVTLALYRELDPEPAVQRTQVSLAQFDELPPLTRRVLSNALVTSDEFVEEIWKRYRLARTTNPGMVEEIDRWLVEVVRVAQRGWAKAEGIDLPREAIDELLGGERGPRY